VDAFYLRSLNGLDPEEWRDLAERAGNIFASPEWVLTWWSHYGKGRSPLIGMARSAGELQAMLPMYERWTHGVPVLRFIGHGPSDQLGPVVVPTGGGGATAVVEELLHELPLRRFLLLAEEVNGDQRFDEVSGARLLYRQSNPVLHIRGDSWDEFMQERSSNFRQQVRRFSRRVAELGTVSYRLSSDPAQLERDLDTLFDLHGKRWAVRTPFMEAESFHREFALRAFRRGWLRLWTLEIDKRPVAAALGFRFAGSELLYQLGRDPAFGHVSLGLLLFVNAVREGLADGIHEFRLLRGDEPYKLRLATADPGLETYGIARGGAARLLISSALAARGRSLGLRRVLDRL
jgi:CelD/BcsL family acetyltransferase involved in cellulose biosynthesis